MKQFYIYNFIKRNTAQAARFSNTARAAVKTTLPYNAVLLTMTLWLAIILIMDTAKSNVNVKIDTSVKEQAARLLDRMGIDQTTAIDMFYRQIIVERRLPFQPTAAQTYGEQVLDLIRRRNIPRKAVEVNAEGHIIVDKDKDPELYDWAVNG